VDNEFIKLAKGCHKGENPVDQFYAANINLATGSEAINAFRPEPPLKKETKLARLPEYTTWDKVLIDGTRGEAEMTVQELVQHLNTEYDATVSRVFPSGDDKICIFDSVDVQKLNWTIEIKEDGACVVEPDEVYTAWPQLKMAVQMLGRLPPGGGARKNFENQILTATKSLQAVKDNFTAKFRGPVSKAYVDIARPKDEEADKQKYFDTVHAKRNHIAFKAYVVNSDGESADLPVIKYIFRK